MVFYTNYNFVYVNFLWRTKWATVKKKKKKTRTKQKHYTLPLMKMDEKSGQDKRKPHKSLLLFYEDGGGNVFWSEYRVYEYTQVY